MEEMHAEMVTYGDGDGDGDLCGEPAEALPPPPPLPGQAQVHLTSRVPAARRQPLPDRSPAPPPRDPSHFDRGGGQFKQGESLRIILPSDFLGAKKI